MSKEIVDLDYIPTTYAGDQIIGAEYKLMHTLDSVAFQFVFTNRVIGTASVQARIIPDKWEQLKGCEPIIFQVNQGDHDEFTEIVVLPDTAKFCSAIRILWEPTSTSADATIRVASRMLPN